MSKNSTNTADPSNCFITLYYYLNSTYWIETPMGEVCNTSNCVKPPLSMESVAMPLIVFFICYTLFFALLIASVRYYMNKRRRASFIA